MRTSTQVSDKNEDNDLNIKERGQGKTKPVEESDNLEDEVNKTEGLDTCDNLEDEVNKPEPLDTCDNLEDEVNKPERLDTCDNLEDEVNKPERLDTCDNLEDEVNKPERLDTCDNLDDKVNKTERLDTCDNLNDKANKTEHLDSCDNLEDEANKPERLDTCDNLEDEVNKPEPLDTCDNLEDEVNKPEPLDTCDNLEDEVNKPERLDTCDNLEDEVNKPERLDTCDNLEDEVNKPERLDTCFNLEDEVNKPERLDTCDNLDDEVNKPERLDTCDNLDDKVNKTEPLVSCDNLDDEVNKTERLDKFGNLEDEVNKTELEQNKIKHLTKFFQTFLFVTVCEFLGNGLIHASDCFFGASKNVLVVGAFVSFLGYILKFVCKIFCANVSTAQLMFGKVALTMSESGIFFLITGIILSLIRTIPLKLRKIVQVLLVVSVACVFFAYLHMPMGTIRLEDITPGTILIHPRPPVISSFRVLYYHLEIVVDIDYKNENITVIGLQTPPDKQFWLKFWDKSSSGKAKIVNFERKFNDIKNCYYRKPTDSNGTIERAQDAYDTQTIDGKKIEYSLGTFNCEHFASYCENGTAVSAQVEEILAVTRSPIIAIGCYDVLVLFVYLCLYQFW